MPFSRRRNKYERVEREMRQVGGVYPANGMQPLNAAVYAPGPQNVTPVNALPETPNVRMVDQNGQVFQPITYFGPLPSNGPVAVPIPSSIVQTTPIVTPISLVPYITQNQPLWQFDDGSDIY